MMESTISAALIRQFDWTWATLSDAIGTFDDIGWRTGSTDFLIPARQAYHLIEAVSFYAEANPDADKFEWGCLGCGWETAPPSQLPSQQAILGYLEETRAKMRRWLSDQSDADFLKVTGDIKSSWPTKLDRALYGLRHTQHHTAQINTELRRRGLPRGKWC